MSDPVKVIALGQLTAAAALSDTDTFAICQNPTGCTASDPLLGATMAQVATYVEAKSPPPVFNGPDVLSAMLHIDLAVNGGHSYRKYTFGQICVITDIIIANPSAAVAGVDFTVTDSTNAVIASGTLSLPDVPNSDTGGSYQRITTGSFTTDAGIADQFTFNVTGNPAAAGVTCDMYLLGFPLQPIA